MAEGKTPNPTRHIMLKTFLIMLVVVAGIGVLAFFQAREYESDLTEKLAVQQDGYVQLVLDEIEVNERLNRSDATIITDILESLEASSNQYWVFSRDQTMLFVRDVTESTRYRGFSSDAFWGMTDAQPFVDSLRQGRATHDTVTIDGEKYLASGGMFLYNGREYRLCLLTSLTSLLGSVTDFGPGTRLGAILLCSLVLLLVVPLIVAGMAGRARKRAAAAQDEALRANSELNDVISRASQTEMHDTRNRVWSQADLATCLAQTLERGASRAYIAKITCPSAQAGNDLVERAAIMLDEQVVRFRMDDGSVVLLFTDSEPLAIQRSLEPLLRDGSQLSAVMPVDPARE